jgi:hypothetical protein
MGPAVSLLVTQFLQVDALSTNGTLAPVVIHHLASLETDDQYLYRIVPETSGPNGQHDSRLLAYHPYISMYQDQDSGSYGPVIIYRGGRMETVMRQNREFVLLYSDNQEWNSFLALHNVQKYLPDMASQVMNLSDQYPHISRGQGNFSFWYPQLINTPKTNVTPTMAPNFFPVSDFPLFF